MESLSDFPRDKKSKLGKFYIVSMYSLRKSLLNLLGTESRLTRHALRLKLRGNFAGPYSISPLGTFILKCHELG